MSEISFNVKQDALALVQNTVIEANFDECKAALTEMIEPYASLVVTEDGIADAKADRAKLRKVATRIDEVRKTVKRAYTEPLTAFESRCKELVAVINAGTENLDRQVKEYEEAEAGKKINALRERYNELADDEIREYLPWGVVNNPKWQNKGYSYDQAAGEIAESIDGVRTDLETIRGMGGDDTPYLLDIYKQTRNLSAVVKKASDLKTTRQREEQRALDEAFRREEDARRRFERARMEAEAAQKTAAASNAPVIEAASEEEQYSVTFRVSCSKAQLMALAQFMKETGIRYTKA